MNAFEKMPRVRIPLGSTLKDIALQNKEAIKSFGDSRANFIIRHEIVILASFRF